MTLQQSAEARWFHNYAIRAPQATHWRKATCEEVDCEAYQNGWTLREEALDDGLRYAVLHSGRRYRRVQITAGETYLVFDAGQPCFKALAHRVRLDREALFLRGRGTYRNFHIQTAKRFRPADFVEDMQAKFDRVRADRQRG